MSEYSFPDRSREVREATRAFAREVYELSGVHLVTAARSPYGARITVILNGDPTTQARSGIYRLEAQILIAHPTLPLDFRVLDRQEYPWNYRSWWTSTEALRKSGMSVLSR